MSLTSGTRLGPYEIVSALGAGGMGEVYRARDTRLDRTVAIKILPETLAADALFRERFAREARAISQLDHPHICALYDVGDHDGTAFLVMPLLEGETLAARLLRGPLPLDQALRCATEIAGALSRAHRAGIVHRDLKPANIMLTKTGAKLLDFGLAKSGPAATGVSGLSMLPTTPPGLTAHGTILGTFQYMAPEQLEGQEADARTDIFAFGATLYEMLTGRKAFQGKSPVSLIGAILKDEPPSIVSSQPLTPPALDRIVTTCLAKDPDDRWQSAGDLQRELRWVGELGTAAPTPATRLARTMRDRVVWIVAGASIATMIALSVFFFRTSPPVPAAIRFEIVPPAGTSFANGPANPHQAVSPNGRRIAFVVLTTEGRAALAVRELGELQAHVVPGTEGIRLGGPPGSGGGNGLPFWSPDSRYIGFFADGTLKKIDVTGGQPQTLCSARDGEGGTWNRDGTIVFARDATGGLFRVSATGGTPTEVTTLDSAKMEQSHRWPWFLPDGRHFLYVAIPTTTLYVGSLDSPERDELFAVESKAVYAEGHLLFTRNGFLLAQPFDVSARRVIGDAFPIAEDIALNPTTARAAVSVSANGVLTYRTASTATNSQLVWMDRSGKAGAVVGEPANQRSPQLSPDDTRIAIIVIDPAANSRDLWIYDVARGGRTRLTFDAADEAVVIWSPDGNRVIFNSRRRQRLFDLFQKASNGAGGEEVILNDDTNSKFATSWSPDGRFILFDTADPSNASKGDLWVLPLTGERMPIPLLQTPFSELNGRFSPNGRLIAYQSDDSGRNEAYVVPFAERVSSSSPASRPPPARWPVSVGGGTNPRWRRDGKELFYLAPDGSLMSVPVIQGPSLHFGTPRSLFKVTRTPGGGGTYDVSADGQRFIVNRQLDNTTPTPITVVVNWTADSGKR